MTCDYCREEAVLAVAGGRSVWTYCPGHEHMGRRRMAMLAAKDYRGPLRLVEGGDLAVLEVLES